MKKKNGLKTAHWILLAITAVSLVAGIVLCLVAKVDFYKLFPIIISAVGLVVTIVLDGIGSKKEKKISTRNTLEKAEAGGDIKVGDTNAPKTGSSENKAKDVTAQGSITVGNSYTRD